jgi:hypothetical protein
MTTATTEGLGTFDGADVIRTRIAVTRAGDGLSEAMKVDPQLMHLGEEIYVVLRCNVAKIRFEDADPKAPGDLCRVHVLSAGDAAIVDGELVAEVVAQQRQRIDEANGVQRLDFDGGDDADWEPA